MVLSDYKIHFKQGKYIFSGFDTYSCVLMLAMERCEPVMDVYCLGSFRVTLSLSQVIALVIEVHKNALKPLISRYIFPLYRIPTTNTWSM